MTPLIFLPHKRVTGYALFELLNGGYICVLKVRKKAQTGVSTIMCSGFIGCSSAPKHHPAAVTTAEFCCQKLESSAGQTNSSYYIILD